MSVGVWLQSSRLLGACGGLTPKLQAFGMSVVGNGMGSQQLSSPVILDSILLSCSTVLLYCSVLLFCSIVLFYGPVLLSCSSVLFLCPVLLFCSTVLFYYSVLLSCSTVLFYSPVLLICSCCVIAYLSSCVDEGSWALEPVSVLGLCPRWVLTFRADYQLGSYCGGECLEGSWLLWLNMKPLEAVIVVKGYINWPE